MNKEKINAIIAMLEEEIEKIDKSIEKILVKKSDITFIESKAIEELIEFKRVLCLRNEEIKQIKNLEFEYINEDFTLKNTDRMIDSYIKNVKQKIKK